MASFFVNDQNPVVQRWLFSLSMTVIKIYYHVIKLINHIINISE